MKGVKKQFLPTKTCKTCLRDFSWRKSGKKIGMKLCIAVKHVAKIKLRCNLESDSKNSFSQNGLMHYSKREAVDIIQRENIKSI